MGLIDRFLSRVRYREVPSPRVTVTSRSDLDRLIAEANEIEDQGRFHEALKLYDAAIEQAPDSVRAHLNRGNALMKIGDTAAAVSAYATALIHDPNSSATYYNLGIAHFRNGGHEEALLSYRRAIELKPEFADAEVALGALYEEIGRPEEAAASYRRALRINPGYAPVHANLGNLLQEIGQFDEAVASYRNALKFDPKLTTAHYGLATALHGLGQYEAAVTSYHEVLRDNPQFAPALGNMGDALRALGRRQEAVASYRRAAAVAPDSPIAHFGLANALNDLGQFEQAIASYRRVLQLEPNHVNAQCMSGNLLTHEGHLNEALACYSRMLEIEPRSILAHNNMGNVFRRLGRMEEAKASYERALEIDPDLVGVHSNLLFIHNSLADQSSALLLNKAREFGELAARQARPFTNWSNPPEPNRRLRVGLVSGDFRSHPVGYFVDSVLASLASMESSKLEFYAYFNHALADDVSIRIQASCRKWQNVARHTDEALAEQIREDGIDILVDLSGHTSDTRVQAFAWKPAPVQATWLGYLGTTGVEAVDYLIADAWTLPAQDEPYFTEKIWRLPESYLCFTPPAETVPPGALPALTKGHITFGSFNNLTKMTDAVVALWARVLNAVPASCLLLKAQQLQEASVRHEVVNRFAQHNIGSERLILEGLVPRSEYLKPFQRVDIALDPFPYPGITTTVESLWMGVPVLTLAGPTFQSRQGLGLLMNAGLPDWIAADEDDYVARAVLHSNNLPVLDNLRGRLRPRVLTSPIFDAPRFAKNFEGALRGMWHEWCAGQHPVPTDTSASQFLAGDAL